MIDSFLAYLEFCSKKYSEEYPAWRKWDADRGVNFWSEIPALAEQGKCELITEENENKLYMTNFFPDKLNEAYKDIEEFVDRPFPNEQSVKSLVPVEKIRYLNSDYDFSAFLSEGEHPPAQIVKIIFPDNFGSALVLAAMLPQQLLEMAIHKVRNYLTRSNNKEYAQHKLCLQIQGKETMIAEMLEDIVSRPWVLYKPIEEAADFTFHFWTHFCAFVRDDIRRKKEHISLDIAVFQSAFIIEAVSQHFRVFNQKKQEKEMAFRELESCLRRPPFLHSMGDILKFTGSKGGPLTNLYTNNELETWLKKKTTESKNDKLPELLVMQGFAKDDLCFLMKEKLLSFTFRLLTEGRFLVKGAVVRLWSKAFLKYEREPGMDSDSEFEKTLLKLAEKLCPALVRLLADPKLLLVYQEAEHEKDNIPPNARIFERGLLLPYSKLFQIQRHEILQEVKLVLPFWYYIPFIAALLRFFSKLFKKRKDSSSDEPANEQLVLDEKGDSAEIKTTAENLELLMVPPGHTLDTYLEELENRWGYRIEQETKKYLINDIKFLVRDKMRRSLKVNRHFNPARENISQMAFDLILRNKALSSITDRDSLLLYIELYFVKFMRNVKSK